MKQNAAWLVKLRCYRGACNWCKTIPLYAEGGRDVGIIVFINGLFTYCTGRL